MVVYAACIQVSRIWLQDPSSQSECQHSGTAADELTDTTADADDVDGCHGNASLSADDDDDEAELSHKEDVNAVENEFFVNSDEPHTEDAVIPSADEDTEEGLYCQLMSTVQ